jgi:hypothetical protein
MLNGRNWWAHPNVEFEYQEDFERKLNDAIESTWNEESHLSDDDDQCIFGLNQFTLAVKSVLNKMNITK